VLAAAGDRGRSRDQLLLLFWPEATQSRARHSLDQLLYALRGSISESVFASVNPVRLAADVVESDVGAFNDALARGDLEEAVERYRGPFLDGFYLDDAPEFERWVETERARLASGFADALERLARTAEAEGDFATAVRWWRTLAATDPLSNQHAIGVVRALMGVGDHAGALQYAEQHETLVEKELGASAGPAIAELVAEVRARANAERTVSDATPSFASSASSSLRSAEQPNDITPAPPPSRRRVSVLGATGFVFVVIASVAALFANRGTSKASPADAEPSLAVLPLVNVSRSAQDAPIVEGLTEELTTAVARIPGLRVVGRTSASGFKDSALGVKRIADSLGVRYVLEGGVQTLGSRLRVQIRLVDAADGSARWSDTYDKQLGDVFEVQRDVAAAVARRLDLTLGGNTLASLDRRPTTSVQAYDLVMRANDPDMIRSDSAAQVALDYARKAIALDSNYAAAYATYARLQVRSLGASDMPRTTRLALAESAAKKAIALDSTLADGYGSLQAVRRNQMRFASAEVDLKRAVALDPKNARYREWMVQLYLRMDRKAEALAEAIRAVNLDPLSPTSHAEYAAALIANDRCDEAMARLETVRSLQIPLLRVQGMLARCYMRKRMWPEAIAAAEANLQRGGASAQSLVAFTYARAGRTADARKILETLLARAQLPGADPADVALVYAGLGENDQAFSWIDKGLREEVLGSSWGQLSHLFDVLQADPRAEEYQRRIATLQNR
jgi:serine/threonine-protein kinase